jgi:3',5'-cyclic AMP phosphodiesterase CpdA
MCKFSIPGRHDGLLVDQTLDWLESDLTAAAHIPSFICFHHPPVVLGAPHGDRIRQFSTDKLCHLVRHHDNVVAVLCGHAHTPASTLFGGKPLLVAPAVQVSDIRDSVSNRWIRRNSMSSAGDTGEPLSGCTQIDGTQEAAWQSPSK